MCRHRTLSGALARFRHECDHGASDSAISLRPRRWSSTTMAMPLPAIRVSIGIQTGPTIGVQEGPTCGTRQVPPSGNRPWSRWASGRLPSGAGLQRPAHVAGLQDITVVRQPIQQRRRHLRVTKHARPLRKGQVRGHDHGRALIQTADQVEPAIRNVALWWLWGGRLALEVGGEWVRQGGRGGARAPASVSRSSCQEGKTR